MSPDLNSIADESRSEGIRSRATDTSVGDRSIATTRAPRRAASIDSAPVPQPASSNRAPFMFAGSHDNKVLRISSRPARTVARIRPTGASDVSLAQASTAVRSK